MKNSPTICQWYVACILSPVRNLFPEANILHYMDNILVCTPEQTYLDITLKKVIKSVGFEISKEKIQFVSPWTYLGVQI